MSASDDIRHLDSHDTSPFEVIVALDETISLMRRALTTELRSLTYDAVRSNREQYLSDAMASLWNARGELVAAVEEES